MATNPIQAIAENLLNDWIIASDKKGVRVIRILTEGENSGMVDAFFDYMLALDIELEDFVFCSESQYSDLKGFCESIIDEIKQEVEIWNTVDVPEEIPYTEIKWEVQNNFSNPIDFLVANLNSFTNYIAPNGDKKLCLIFKYPNFKKKDIKTFFSLLFNSNLSENIIIGLADYKEHILYDELMTFYPNEVCTIAPPIDLGKAMEQLAAQEATEEKKDSIYRVCLMRLMNKARNKDSKGVINESKSCLDIAVKEVEKDPNWLAQIVAVYTIVYNDKIRTKDYKDALYFSNKAVEAAKYSEKLIDPTMSYRLIGQTNSGKGSILSVMKKWEDAFIAFEEASKAYASCHDYLMECENLRLAGWAKEKTGREEEATEFYIKAFYLIDNLSPDLARNSTYPLVLKKLINNQYRIKTLSDKEMDDKLIPVFGKGWRAYVKSFGKLNQEK